MTGDDIDRAHPATMRRGDSSITYRAANSPSLTLIYRGGMVAAFGVLSALFVFVAGRLIGELDTNTKAQATLATQQAVTATILDGVVRRVDSLERRERWLERTP